MINKRQLYLKCCPKCDNTNILISDVGESTIYPDLVIIRCNNCHESRCGFSLSQARRNWNRRKRKK